MDLTWKSNGIERIPISPATKSVSLASKAGADTTHASVFGDNLEA